MNEIQFTVENHIATIHLNRQRVGNAFSTEMMEKWCNIFAEIQKKEDIRCVVVKSELPNAFTFGGDIREEQHLKGDSARRFSGLGQACVCQMPAGLPLPSHLFHQWLLSGSRVGIPVIGRSGHRFR